MSKTVLGECLFEEIDKLKKENKQLEERIDKAIEYIEKNSEMTNLQLYGIENILVFRGDSKELLEILKGDSNE